MFVQLASRLATNTVIEFNSTDYMFFGSNDTGDIFTRAGVDVTAGVSNVNRGAFDQDTNITCDQTDVIVDNDSNVFYKVTSYQTVQTTRPARS